MYEDILTVDEAAELLKAARETVLDLLMSGEIPGRSIGGEWRTTKRALISFVDGVPIQAACCSTADGCCSPCQPGMTGCPGMAGRTCA